MTCHEGQEDRHVPHSAETGELQNGEKQRGDRDGNRHWLGPQ